MIKLNVVLAVVLGFSLAIGESIRRYGTEFSLPSILDDYIMSALLILGAWRALRSTYTDLRLLLTGWSFSCGMLYLSFFGNLDRYMSNPSNPGISAPIWVILIFIAFGTSIFGTLTVFRAMKQA